VTAPTNLQKPPTFDRLKKKAPLEQKVTVVVDAELFESYEQATSALERAKLLNEPTEELEAAATAAEEALRQDGVETLVFRSIGRKAYDALVEEYPPTEEQITEYRADNPQRDGSPGKGKPAYNIETFAPALIAASCVEPEMTVEQVTELFDGWTSVEIQELWVAALAVNTQRRVVKLGKG
jgi:hypothetical protein